MARICVLLVVVIGCHGGRTEDECKIVAEEPGDAMATIAKRHKGDPAAAAEIIENCLAPTGDDCERLQKIIPALPKLMPASGASLTGSQVATLCKDAMTPEMRRCMFPSYTLRHTDECAQVLQKLQATSVQLDLPGPGSGVADKPVVVVTKTEVLVGKDVIGSVEDGSTMAALTKKLRPTGDGVVLLQADETTDVRVINKIVTALKGAGFHNVQFVVKNQ